MRFIVALAFGGSLVCVGPAAACQIVTFKGSPAKPTAIELIGRADVIVVAVARESVPASLPQPEIPLFNDPEPRRTDRILFEVTETLKGKAAAPLLFKGYFTDRDDFNNVAIPANGVRPNGLGGGCFAYHYRRDAAYLLFLQRTPNGELSPYWDALSRLNDQIRPNGDPWLDWVRSRVAGRR